MQGAFTGAILKAFLPFMENTRIEACSSSRDFDFSILSAVRVHGFRLHLRGKSEFVILLLPEGKSFKSKPVKEISLAGTRKVIRENFTSFGYAVQKAEYIDGGSKNLTAPPDLWRKEKIIFSMILEGHPAYLVIPVSFLSDILFYTGLGYMPETGEAVLKKNTEKFLKAIERSIRFGRNRLYISAVQIFQKAEDRHVTALLAHMLNRGLVTLNHLVSWHILHESEYNLLSRLPGENRKIAEKLRGELSGYLEKEKVRLRWKMQLDYSFQNILSRLLVDEEPEQKYFFDIFHGRGITGRIDALRLNDLLVYSSPERLMKRLIHSRRLNCLIKEEGSRLMARAAAFDVPLPLEMFFKLYKNNFKEEFYHRMRAEKTEIRSLSGEESQIRYTATVKDLVSLLEKNLTGSEACQRKNLIDTPRVHQFLKDLDTEGLMVLYYKTGFERLADMFNLLRSADDSTLDSESAAAFTRQTVSKLPAVEASIVEDIYFDRVNRGRLITEETLLKIRQYVTGIVPGSEENCLSGMNA